MEPVTSVQFINSTFWKFIETISKKGLSLIISLVLARMLMPEHYGIIALTTVFITFSDIFILNGFNIALIRKYDVKPVDYSTVMCLSLIFSGLLYFVFFLTAPLIADYYNTAELKPVLRIIMLLLFFQSCSTVERAKATREMQFKLMSIVAFTSNIVAGGIGVALAYKGFGVWALVVQQVSLNFFDMILMTIFLKWDFSLHFSRASAKELLKFSMGVIGASFLDFAGNNITSLVIGKVNSPVNLGYYNRGAMLPEQVYMNVYNTINSALLPMLASRQTNIERIKAVVRRIIPITTYIIFPLLGGLMIVAPRLVPFLITDRWLPSVPLMQWICVIYAFNAIRAVNGNVLYAIGKSKLNFRIETIRCFTLITVMVLTLNVLKLGLNFLVASNAMVAVLVALLTQFWTKKQIGYTYGELFWDIAPALILTSTMIIIVFFVGYLPLGDTSLLFIQIFVGIVVYICLSKIFRIKSFYEIVNIIRSMKKHV